MFAIVRYGLNEIITLVPLPFTVLHAQYDE